MPTFAAEKIVKLIKIPKYETIISVDITFRLSVVRQWQYTQRNA
jgi:hypothetical protein